MSSRYSLRWIAGAASRVEKKGRVRGETVRTRRKLGFAAIWRHCEMVTTVVERPSPASRSAIGVYKK
jgi:hypothetical protein